MFVLNNLKLVCVKQGPSRTRNMYSVSATKQEELFLWLCSVFVLKAVQAGAGPFGTAGWGLSEN